MLAADYHSERIVVSTLAIKVEAFSGEPRKTRTQQKGKRLSRARDTFTKRGNHGAFPGDR
jgi:hypothetical protein